MHRVHTTIALPRRLAGLIFALLPIATYAEDWPTWRHDRLRTARTSERLSLPLSPIWKFTSRQAADAPTPTSEPQRANFPECSLYTLPLIAAGDGVFFTSAIDGRIVCLDAATGETRWQFVAGGAVNRTAMFSDGRIYAASDDGNVYCLDSKTGTEQWTYRAAPADRQMLAYGRMISSWPVRTDVVVDEGVAYFAAGVFPHDGTFVYAIDAKSGKLLWRNGTQSEDGGQSSLAPGGHLYLTRTQVYIPKDFRGYSNLPYGAPTPFARKDGKFDMWPNPKDPEVPKIDSNSPWTRIFWPLHGVEKDGVRYGGTNAWKVENEERGRQEVWKHDIPGRWSDYDSGVGVRIKGKPVIFRYDPDHANVIVAGDTLLHSAFDTDPKKGVGSGVYARKLDDGTQLWTAEFPERANQIIAANGRLFVGTRSGTIYAFASGESETRAIVEKPSETKTKLGGVAEAILENSGHREGYAVVLDSESGHLSLELARHSKLSICAVFDDEVEMRTARKLFGDDGVHLNRISTHLRTEGQPLPFPSYFADLVVSERAILKGALPGAKGDWARVLKPIRGVALFGGSLERPALESWSKTTDDRDWNLVELANLGHFARRVRPRLSEAGGWTHMHGDAGNTSCSHDGELRGPLGVTWYGPPTVTRPGKHTSIIIDGLLVLPEPHSLEACDQYTGRRLWKFEARNIGASLAASRSHIYARYEHVMLQIDLFTGKHLRSFLTPFGKEHAWGWFAVALDGKTVYGASAGGVWATEMESGKGDIRWMHGGPEVEESAKLGGSMAMSDGRIYVLGREAKGPLRDDAIAQMRAFFKTQSTELREEFEKQVDQRDIRELTAIDTKTGKILYTTGVDITNCGGKWLRPAHFGSKRHYNPYVFLDMYANADTVVIGSASRADKGWGVWNGGGYKSRALTAYDGKTGKLLWYKFTNHRTRPVIIDRTIHAEPWAFDLRTGEKQQRVHPITGERADWAWCRFDKQCGVFSASRHFLFGRNKGFGYKDLDRDQGLYTFWHSRSNCYVDHVSGGGLMIKPPQAIYCDCMWSLPFSVALGQVSTAPPSAPKFAQPGPSLPVKHLHLDFGANGDRRDDGGNLWISVTNRHRNHLLLLGYDAQVSLYEGGREIRRSASFTKTAKAETPFVFASSIVGLRSCVLPLVDAATSPDGKRYSVRLGFAAPPGDEAGQRVFDVKIDGRTVLESFDVAREAGAAEIAIWKEFDVDAGRFLTIDLVTKSASREAKTLPLLNGVEIRRLPSKSVTMQISGETWLSAKTPAKKLEIEIRNWSDEATHGRLSIESSSGLTGRVAPQDSWSIPANSSVNAELHLERDEPKEATAARHEVRLTLVDESGKRLSSTTQSIEWLGKLDRRVLFGGSRPILHETLRRSWHERAKPHRGNDLLFVSKEGDEPDGPSASASILWFHVPQDLRDKKAHSARLRLHRATGLGEMLGAMLGTGLPAAASASSTSSPLPSVQRLVGPPWPDVNKVQIDSLPAVRDEPVNLARESDSSTVYEVALPGGAAVDPKDGNIYLRLSPNAPGGAVFWGSSSPDRSLAPVLILDYEVAENPKP